MKIEENWMYLVNFSQLWETFIIQHLVSSEIYVKLTNVIAPVKRLFTFTFILQDNIL
jgi:hypothetical protein